MKDKYGYNVGVFSLLYVVKKERVMGEKFKALFQSRRFLAAIAAVVFMIVSQFAEIGITQEMVTNIMLVVAAWIVGDSLKETSPIGGWFDRPPK